METYQFEAAILAAIEASPVPFAIFQYLDGRVVTVAVTDGFRALFGFETPEETCRLTEEDLFRGSHPEDAARIADASRRFAAEDGALDVVYRAKDPGGDGFMVIHAIGARFRPAPDVRLGVIWYTREGSYSPEPGREESDLSRALSQMLREGGIVRYNRYDSLTGLPSMTWFFELAELGRRRLREAGRTPAILFFDLGGMKAFNRTNGFSGGDQLLRAFGQALADRFGRDSCSRFGQDHFAVLADAAWAGGAAEDIFRAARTLNGGRTLPVRAGVYVDRDPEVALSAACDRAKLACDAKRNSRFSVCAYFDQRMLEAAVRRQYIIDNLDRALEQRWIQVWYQPIIRASSGRVCDEEALARWQDPELGLLSPADFIPILEDAGLIHRLDLYVVDRVLEKLRQQREAGLDLVPVSVNLSRADFDACDMVEELRRRVDEAGFRRSMLNIELTESAIGSDFAYMKEQIDRFRLQGFRVWMDDFGSGNSSLDVLQNIQLDLVKLDMRFIRQFDRTERSRIILTELMRMAAGLGLDTVAEGVEREEQLKFLQEIGCGRIQGYYFCRPIPEEEIRLRYRDSRQIGFEDPAQAEYYASLGRINLYDLSAVANDESYRHYFDTVPMAILEADLETFTLLRCNRAYREFMEEVFGILYMGSPIPYAGIMGMPGDSFILAIRDCGETGERTVYDEALPDGAVIHALLRRVSINPVTKKSAVAVAVLTVS